MFAPAADARQGARFLRSSTKSVYQWRCAWRVGAEATLGAEGGDGNAYSMVVEWVPG